MQWRTTCAVIKWDTRQISTRNQQPTAKANTQNSTFQHNFNRPNSQIPMIQQNSPTKPNDSAEKSQLFSRTYIQNQQTKATHIPIAYLIYSLVEELLRPSLSYVTALLPHTTPFGYPAFLPKNCQAVKNENSTFTLLINPSKTSNGCQAFIPMTTIRSLPLLRTTQFTFLSSK